MDTIIGEEEIRCLLYGKEKVRKVQAAGLRSFVVIYVEIGLDKANDRSSEYTPDSKELLLDRFQTELTKMHHQNQGEIVYSGSHGYRSCVFVLSFISLNDQDCRDTSAVIASRLFKTMPRLRIGVSPISSSLYMLRKLLHQAEYYASAADEFQKEQADNSSVIPADAKQDLKHRHHANVVERIKRHIREHLEQIETVEQIAAHFYFSPSYMNHIFKKHTGVTVFDYIISSRVEAAKRMLAEPKVKACEVSLRLGYQNYSHFNALFKQRTGMTPKQYSRNFG